MYESNRVDYCLLSWRRYSKVLDILQQEQIATEERQSNGNPFYHVYNIYDFGSDQVD